MINKILNIWISCLMILCMFCLTVGPFVVGIVFSLIFNDPLWLLFNLAYIILIPPIVLSWGYIFDIIGSGGII